MIQCFLPGILSSKENKQIYVFFIAVSVMVTVMVTLRNSNLKKIVIGSAIEK